MKNIFVIVLVVLGFVACGDSGQKKLAQTAVTAVEKASEGKPLNYPSITDSIVQRLFKECSYMDYIFHDLDFSLSQTELGSIRSSLRYISTDVPSSIPDGCKSMGRKFFHIDGEIVLEAELYFSRNCAFYVFYVDNKPTYANVLTKTGINFYNNIIKQGQGTANDIKAGKKISGAH